MKYKDFKMLSDDDMKQIVGGNAPDEDEVGHCKVLDAVCYINGLKCCDTNKCVIVPEGGYKCKAPC